MNHGVNDAKINANTALTFPPPPPRVAQGWIPLDSHPGPEHEQIVSVTLHVVLRVVDDPSARKLYVRGFVFMADVSSFNLHASNAQMRAAEAFNNWAGRISLR